MSALTELDLEFDSIASDADAIASQLEDYSHTVSLIEEAIGEANKAHSGSWLGYHSRVYYNGLKSPPVGANFDPASGLRDGFGSDTCGEWREFEYDRIYDGLKSSVSETDFEKLQNASKSAWPKVIDLQEKLISLLSAIIEKTENQFVEKLLKEANNAKPLSVNDFVEHFKPSGQFYSRDTAAIHSGLKTPPHVALYALVQSIETPFNAAKSLSKLAARAKNHLQHRKSSTSHAVAGGGKVFLGHGRSQVWRDLKDFLQDRLDLQWDEFNRVPIAGYTNIARLSEMLNGASIAFLIMTAEDEQKDGKLQARMNVIHEAGLFQGKLGFTRAIVVLEEGCEEFSNIQGLGQLRFPAGNISAIFEDIREILERENMLD